MEENNVEKDIDYIWGKIIEIKDLIVSMFCQSRF